jgi:DNA-binding MarR family transcriptional regulator
MGAGATDGNTSQAGGKPARRAAVNATAASAAASSTTAATPTPAGTTARAPASAGTTAAAPAPAAPTAGAPAPPDTTAVAPAAHDGQAWSVELTDLGRAFRRVFRGLIRMRGRDTHLGGTELSHAQFELLIELYERGELPAGELAAAARLSPAAVTQMLDHLAESGHVERVRSSSDRRVVVSRLTPQGRRKILAKRAVWQRRWEHALDGLSARELRAATRVLERLSAVFEDAEDCPAQDSDAA